MEMNKRNLIITLLSASIVAFASVAMWAESTSTQLKKGNDAPKDTLPKIALAYVPSGGKKPLDANLFTHLIYAFIDFNDSCDGIVIKNPERLQALVDLKKENPELKVLAGVAATKREGFSEMTRDKKKRKAFIKDIKHLVDSLNLDGVDFDWEFPTTENGGHTATPQDDKNYVTFVKELRKALGKKKWISYYSHNTALYIDHKRMAPYVSYVNVSGYNLNIPKDGKPGKHQSPLYPSKKFGEWSILRSVEKHIDLGVPQEKILVGIPFYERGKSPFPTYAECRQFDRYTNGLTLEWDEEAQVPYYADKNGDLVAGFDDERSIKAKFDFIRANGLNGVFVWHYGGDYDDQRLAKTIKKLRK